jgi:hypothetical protein
MNFKNIGQRCEHCKGSLKKQSFIIEHYIAEEDKELEFCSISCQEYFIAKRLKIKNLSHLPKNQETLF